MVAVVVFDGDHAVFFVGPEMNVGIGLGIDQTLTVRSRQAVTRAFASFVLIAIFTIV